MIGIERGAQSCEHRLGVHRGIAPRGDEQIALIGGERCRRRNADGHADDRCRNDPPFEQRAALVEQRIQSRERSCWSHLARDAALRNTQQRLGAARSRGCDDGIAALFQWPLPSRIEDQRDGDRRGSASILDKFTNQSFKLCAQHEQDRLGAFDRRRQFDTRAARRFDAHKSGPSWIIAMGESPRSESLGAPASFDITGLERGECSDGAQAE